MEYFHTRTTTMEKGLNPNSYNRRSWSLPLPALYFARETRYNEIRFEKKEKGENKELEKRRNRVFVSSGHCRVRETLGRGELVERRRGRKFTKSQRWNESTRGNAKQGFQHGRNSFQGIRGISYTRGIHAKNSEHVNLGKSCE